MPFRVQNNTTKAVYTVGVVSDDETDITSESAPALTSDGMSFRPPAYGDEASAELASPKKKGSAS